MIEKFYNGFIIFLENVNQINTSKFLAMFILMIFIWFIRNIILRLCK